MKMARTWYGRYVGHQRSGRGWTGRDARCRCNKRRVIVRKSGSTQYTMYMERQEARDKRQETKERSSQERARGRVERCLQSWLNIAKMIALFCSLKMMRTHVRTYICMHSPVWETSEFMPIAKHRRPLHDTPACRGVPIYIFYMRPVFLLSFFPFALSHFLFFLFLSLAAHSAVGLFDSEAPSIVMFGVASDDIANVIDSLGSGSLESICAARDD